MIAEFHWMALCECGWTTTITTQLEAERQVEEHKEKDCLGGFDDCA